MSLRHQSSRSKYLETCFRGFPVGSPRGGSRGLQSSRPELDCILLRFLPNLRPAGTASPHFAPPEFSQTRPGFAQTQFRYILSRTEPFVNRFAATGLQFTQTSLVARLLLIFTVSSRCPHWTEEPIRRSQRAPEEKGGRWRCKARTTLLAERLPIVALRSTMMPGGAADAVSAPALARVGGSELRQAPGDLPAGDGSEILLAQRVAHHQPEYGLRFGKGPPDP